MKIRFLVDHYQDVQNIEPLCRRLFRNFRSTTAKASAKELNELTLEKIHFCHLQVTLTHCWIVWVITVSKLGAEIALLCSRKSHCQIAKIGYFGPLNFAIFDLQQ
jgi:hypothetical protein